MSKTIFEIEGFDTLQRKIEQLPDKVKRREMLRLMRAAAKPTVSAARQEAPVGNRVHKRYSRRDGSLLATYQPGNLRKSIGNITGRKGLGRQNAVIYVGPRSKGRKYDGYYGAMVHGGTKWQKPNPFMKRAYNKTEGRVTKELEERTVKYVQKQIDRLSR